MNVKRLEKKMMRHRRRLEKKLERLNKKLEGGQIRRRLGRSHMDIRYAIETRLETDEFHAGYEQIFRVDQKTGECVDYLIYFPNYDIIAKIYKYLEAYLITNEGVLEDSTVGELEGLMRYFR